MRFSYMRLLVDDFPSEFHFYAEVMGFEVLWGDASGNYAEFAASSDTKLAITSREVIASVLADARQGADAGPEDSMIVFEVDDVDTAAGELEARGGPLISKPADREQWGVRTVHFRDPEGRLIELNAPLADVAM